VSGRPLDCVGPDGQLGKHDFVPDPAAPIIHGAGGLTGERYVSEKITELALTQQALRRVVNKNIALIDALKTIESGELPDGRLVSPNAQQFAAETLAKLEAGELRKVVT
jgi:hypothetical protein